MAQVEAHVQLRLGWALLSRTLVRRLMRQQLREMHSLVPLKGGGSRSKGKYGPACSSVAIEFAPAVFEAFGACGPAFAGLFKPQVAWAETRAGGYDPMGGFTAPTFSSWWQQRVSVASQLGNARCVIARAKRGMPRHGVLDGHDDTSFPTGSAQ